MTTEILTPLQHALKYHDYGFSVVPLESKKKTPEPRFDLDNYFNTRATRDALVTWFDSGTSNIAIIMGAVSKAFAIDIDGDAASMFLKDKVGSMSGNLQAAIANTMASKTGKGLHLIFRYKPEEFISAGGLKTKKLWVDPSKQKHSEIMIKAEGGYIVAPPSIHPETGKPYELVEGKGEPHLLIKSEIEELVRVINPRLSDQGSDIGGSSGSNSRGPSSSMFQDVKENNPLTPEKMGAILEIIGPFYIEGQRNEIVFDLSGYLRKNGAPRDNTKRLIAALAEKTHDPEKASRLVTVERTYNKNINEIKGFTGLLDLLRLQTDDRKALDVMADLKEIVEKNRPIESSELSRKLEKQDEPDLVEEATEAIMQDFRFLTIEETRDILYYKDGVYIYGGDTLIEKFAESLYGYRLKTKDVNEIRDHIIRKTMKSKSFIDANLEIINLKNGLYNWRTNTLSEHSPDYISIDQKPIVYRAGAKPKLFGKYLKEVLYPTEVRTAIELMAYTFYKDNPYELITILTGSGSNGKSVFTSVMETLHGQPNVSHVTLKQMLEDTYALSDLYSKSVNIDPELSDMTISDTAVLKRLTGRQPIRAHRKNQRAFDFINHAKLFFNANKIPRTDDDSDAWYRRNVIISFPNQFEDAKADPELVNKLTTPEELAGIFNMLMVALRTIIVTRKKITTHEKTIQARREKYELAMNPYKVFVKQCIERNDVSQEDTVIKEHLYIAYKRFCNHFKLAMDSDATFGKKIKDMLKLEDGRESRGDRRTYWKNIRLIAWDNPDEKQATLGI